MRVISSLANIVVGVSSQRLTFSSNVSDYILYNLIDINIHIMLSFYCLLATIILIVSYTIFTYNYPPYDLFIKAFAHNCTNDFIKFLSIINLSIFISGNLIVLFYNNTSYEQLKKKGMTWRRGQVRGTGQGEDARGRKKEGGLEGGQRRRVAMRRCVPACQWRYCQHHSRRSEISPM